MTLHEYAISRTSANKVSVTKTPTIATLSKLMDLLWNSVELEAASSGYIEYVDDESDIVIDVLDGIGIK